MSIIIEIPSHVVLSNLHIAVLIYIVYGAVYSKIFVQRYIADRDFFSWFMMTAIWGAFIWVHIFLAFLEFDRAETKRTARQRRRKGLK